MRMSMARTRLLKMVMLRPAVRPFWGRVSPLRSPRSRPIARISPVSMRAFGLPRAPSSDMAVQHHPEELHAGAKQGVREASRHALWGAGRVHDEQDDVEGTPEIGSGEHLARHRRVEQDHVPVLLESPDDPGEL